MPTLSSLSTLRSKQRNEKKGISTRVTVTIVYTTFLLAIETLLPDVFAALPFEPYAGVYRPVGLDFNGEVFILSSSPEKVTLKTVSLDGSVVKDFAPVFWSEGEVYIAVSPGLGGFPKGYIYVNSADWIFEISPDGTRAQSFSQPLPGNSVMYLAFDKVGTWGHQLLAVNGNGIVWIIDPSGVASRVASLGDDMFPESITVAPLDFGVFGGFLLVSEEWGGKINAISPEPGHEVSILASFPGEPLERILFVPPSSDLFINKYEENFMFRLSHIHLQDYVGSLLVISEGEYGQPASIYAISPPQSASEEFVITPIETGILGPHFEGAVFVEVDTLLAQAVRAPAAYSLFDVGLVAAAGVLVAVVVLFILKQRLRRR